MMKNETQFNGAISDKDEKVLKSLVNIASFCPSVILSDARKRRDLNQLLCDDPRANEFIKLDSQIYIDKDDKDVKKFGDAVFDLVTSLCDLIRYKHNDLNFTVIPGGSFPLNVKVENLDEFDYVLAWENKAEFAEYQELMNGCVDVVIYKGSMLLIKILDAIKVVLLKSEEKQKFSDIELLIKCHAINIKFSWSCSSKHKHSVSLDLAISIKTSSTIQEFFSQKEFPFQETPFEDSININEKIYLNCRLTDTSKKLYCCGYPGRIDTNIFDKQMFKTCDKISLNIKLCYRVLKFIRGCIFPYRVGVGFSYLTKRWSNYVKDTFSSYSLKQVLFQEVIKFPSKDHWQNSRIHDRIASMLQKLLNYPKDVFYTKNRDPSTWTLNEVSYAFTPILKNLEQWLHNGCKSISSQQRSILSECGEGIKVLLENKMVISLAKFSFNAFEFESFIGFQILKLKSFRPLVFYDGFLGGLYEAFESIVENMDHVDLTSFSDKEFEELIFLLRFSIITKKEIDCNNYSSKLKIFKEMLEMYEISCSDAYDKVEQLAVYYSVSSKDVPLYKIVKEKMSSIFISLEEIYTSLSWKDGSYIYWNDYYIFDFSGFFTEKPDAAMEQTINRVNQKTKTINDAFKEPSWNDQKVEQMLWLLVSISSLKNLK